MTTPEPTPRRAVRLERQIRLTFPTRPGLFAELLKTLRQSGGDVFAHLVYELHDESVGLFVCESPKKAALAFESAGLQPETETVVLVHTENRWGALSHLVKVLEDEELQVGYTYAASLGTEICVVLHTNDDDRAAAALRRYLVLADEGGQPGPG